MSTRTISLYENNAGDLVIYDSKRDAYVVGLEQVSDSPFTDDAKAIDDWWDEWAERWGWYGGTPDVSENAWDLIATFEGGSVKTVGTPGLAGCEYLQHPVECYATTNGDPQGAKR
jgi:hypothetical protein